MSSPPRLHNHSLIIHSLTLHLQYYLPLLFLFISLLHPLNFASCQQPPFGPNSLSPGSTFAYSTGTAQFSLVLASPNNSFVLAFTGCSLFVSHNDNGSFSTQVWEVRFDQSDASCYDTTDVVTLTLQQDGDLVVLKNNRLSMWRTGTANMGVNLMQLYETGNLALNANSAQPVWQSFDHPTNLLLSGQRLQLGMNLRSSGYTLVLEPNRLVLYFYTMDVQALKPYWQLLPAVATTQVAYAALDGGAIQLYDASNNPLINQTTMTRDAGGLWRMQLVDSSMGQQQHGGNLAFFRWVDNTGSWQFEYESLTNMCQFPDACRDTKIHRSLATCDPISQQCFCGAPLMAVIGSPDCHLDATLANGFPVANTCSPATSRADKRTEFLRLKNRSYFSLVSGAVSGFAASLFDCRSYCKRNCSCSAFVYNNRSCYPLLDGEVGDYLWFVMANDGSSAFVRVTSGAAARSILSSSRMEIIIEAFALLLLLLLVIGW